MTWSNTGIILLMTMGLGGCLAYNNDTSGRGNLPAYDVCFSSNQCAVLGVSCVAPGAQNGRFSANFSTCTKGCENNRECPPDFSGSPGVCVKFEGRGVCHQGCSAHAQCPSGFDCADRAGTARFPAVCLPRS